MPNRRLAGDAPALQFAFDMTGPELLDSLTKVFGSKVQAKTEFRGETTVTILLENLREVARMCRDDLAFD